MARDKNAEERIESIAYSYGSGRSGDIASEVYDEEMEPIVRSLENLVAAILKPASSEELTRITEEGRQAVLYARGLANFDPWETDKAEPIKDN